MPDKKKKKRKVKPQKRAPSKLPARRVLKSNQFLHLQRQMDEMKGAALAKTRGDRAADYIKGQGLHPLVSNVINVGQAGGASFQSLNPSEKEALDKMRHEPDILKGIRKKEVSRAMKRAAEREEVAGENFTKAQRGRDGYTEGLKTATGTPSQRRQRTPRAQASSSSSEGEASTMAQVFGAFRHTARERAEDRRGAAGRLQKAAKQQGITLNEEEALGHTHRGSYTPSASRQPEKVQGRRDLFRAGFGKDESGSVWAAGASTSPQTNFGWEDDTDA